jgi:hypothetical protein
MSFYDKEKQTNIKFFNFVLLNPVSCLSAFMQLRCDIYTSFLPFKLLLQLRTTIFFPSRPFFSKSGQFLSVPRPPCCCYLLVEKNTFHTFCRFVVCFTTLLTSLKLSKAIFFSRKSHRGHFFGSISRSFVAEENNVKYL